MRRILELALVLLIIWGWAVLFSRGGDPPGSPSALAQSCPTPGDGKVPTWSAAANDYICQSPASSSGSIPVGAIVIIAQGDCAATLGTGWAEITAFSGVMLRGTLAANADIGGTGGSDTITPVGTNAATVTTGNCAATVKTGTSSSTACSSTTPNLAVPGEQFTGSPFDNRPAFVKVIFCQKT
jgi:hypothetical protein